MSDYPTPRERARQRRPAAAGAGDLSLESRDLLRVLADVGESGITPAGLAARAQSVGIIQTEKSITAVARQLAARGYVTMKGIPVRFAITDVGAAKLSEVA